MRAPAVALLLAIAVPAAAEDAAPAGRAEAAAERAESAARRAEAAADRTVAAVDRLERTIREHDRVRERRRTAPRPR
jgi:hypothetical protein